MKLQGTLIKSYGDMHRQSIKKPTAIIFAAILDDIFEGRRNCMANICGIKS
jgi:hypothetical protein